MRETKGRERMKEDGMEREEREKRKRMVDGRDK